MSDIEKRLNKSAWKNALVWGTEVDVNVATLGILPLNAGALKLSIPPVEEESAVSAMESDLDIPHKDPVDFSLEFDGRYEGLGSIMAQVFGTDERFVVADSCKYIDFDEGAAELTATLTLGTYTADALCAEMKTQLDAAGALTYTVTHSKATRKFTIAAPSNFTLRWDTGTHKATDISDMCGFNDAANDTGASTYTADYTRFHFPKGGPTQQGATAAYLHVLDLKAKVSGLFGTYATEKHDRIHVVPSAKPHKLTFGTDAGKLKITADFKGNNLIDNSGVVGSMASVNPPDKHNRIFFHQAVLRMNASANVMFDVTATNKHIDFKENGDELTATLDLGSYTSTALCTEIKKQLEEAGAFTYTITYSTSTHKFTIAASSTFSLLWNTGTHKATDISDLCGYSDAADDTGSASYVADNVSGSAFADGDKIKVKSLTIEIERTPEGGAHESGELTIIETLEEGKATVKITLEFNRMDDVNKAYFADWVAGNEKKLDIVFTGAEIASPYDYYFKFELPRLVIEDVDYPDENIIPAKIVLRGLEADAAPYGMTGITKPVRLSIMNKRTNDMLGA